MSILDKRSFEDFKKYLEENASSKLLEKFKGGELKCILKPLSTDASMWANKTGPNMVEIGGASFIDDKYQEERFDIQFGIKESKELETFDARYENLIRRRYPIGPNNSTSGIIEKNYSFVDFGTIVVRVHILEEKVELSRESFEIPLLVVRVLKDFFLGEEWNVC